jgi:GntR family transcriptional regulator / MocR family aminotransferase
VDIHISLEGRRDLAGQIYRQFRDAIRDRRLKAGQILPPSRELSRRLAVSRNTVGVAYDRLIGEGFIETRIGAGTYVCEHSGMSASTAGPRPALDHSWPARNCISIRDGASPPRGGTRSGGLRPAPP